MLNEDRNSTISKGCLMAMIPKEIGVLITNFGKKIIPDEDLYIKDGEFGRETESHVTVRYGFTKDLNELEIRQIIGNQEPFEITFEKLDKFESDDFDVVILRSENPIIKKWHKMLGIYPNESEFSDYKQHMTIAYVKKGTFPHTKELGLVVPVDSLCYSPINGGKSYFNLKQDVKNYEVNELWINQKG